MNKNDCFKRDMVLLEFLKQHKGKENVVGSSEISSHLAKHGYTTKNVRPLVKKIMYDYNAPICHFNANGYFWAKTRDDILGSIKDLECRIKALNEHIAHLKKKKLYNLLKRYVVKSYKGFDKDLKCRGFQFEVGKEYEESGVKVCEHGFHACESPLNVFSYYPPATSRYCEVEQSGELKSKEDKTASSKIKIQAEIGIPGLVKAHIEYVKSRCTTEHTDPKLATAGSYGAATAGYRGAATSRGSSSVGVNGVALARGNGCRVRGGEGAILVIAEENDDNFDIKEWKAFVVDGEKIKPDTWYKLVDGELVEE